jgi:hypothetical protein
MRSTVIAAIGVIVLLYYYYSRYRISGSDILISNGRSLTNTGTNNSTCFAGTINKNDVNQKWKIQKDSSGAAYEIIPLSNPGLRLDVFGASKDEGSVVGIFTNTPPQSNQRFKLTYTLMGYNLSSVNSGLYLAYNRDGTLIQQKTPATWTCQAAK